jgi:LysM repeat protein
MGRYQFLQGVWQDEIFRFAEENGYKYQGPQDFVSNSALQDDFFEFYVQEHLVPFANQIKKKYDVSFMTDEEILASLHFIGPTKFKHTLVNNTQDQPQSYSTSLNDYLSRIPQNYFADGGQATSWLNDSLALAGKPVMPTSNQPQGQTYQVKAGDNLSKIAQEYGTDLKTLTELNPDIDPSSYTIYVDQQLNLPPTTPQGLSQTMSTQASASTQPSGKKYVVKAGDNLSKISKELGE